MTTISRFFSGIIAWLGLSLVAAQAVVVNVDFNGNSGAPTTYTGQGALVTADAHYWNPLNGPAPTGTNLTATSLLASDGITPTTISVTISNVLEYNFAPGGPNPSGNALIDDCYFNAGYTNGTPSSFSIDGLTPGKTYSLYLYGDAAYNPNGNNQYFQIGATQIFPTGRSSGANATGTPNFWVSGVDYGLFTVVANGSGQVNGSWGADVGNGFVFNGLQIEEVVLMPEPSTVLLLGIGGLLVWRRTRRG